MGVMKRLHTELRSGNGKTLSRFVPEERQGWEAVRKGSDAVVLAKRIQEERDAVKDDDALESINLELRYTYPGPTINGQYLIVDQITQSRRFANFTTSQGIATLVVDGQVKPFGDFCKPLTQRWFLIPKFTPEDLSLVRELPT